MSYWWQVAACGECVLSSVAALSMQSSLFGPCYCYSMYMHCIGVMLFDSRVKKGSRDRPKLGPLV